MTPTVHFDIKKAEEASVAYDAIAHFSVSIVTAGTRAKTEFADEIKEAKQQLAAGTFADHLIPTIKQNVLDWATMGTLIDGLAVAAKESQAVMAKLEKAIIDLKKKPADKKAMEAFAVAIKNASLNCGKQRTALQRFTDDKRRFLGAGTKPAYANYLKLLGDYLTNCMPKLAPPRPLSGPPVKK
jgi:hypothetical protein